MVSGGVVLCVGEAIIALSPPAGVGLQVASDLLVSVGGAEANVAVQLAQLGVPSRFAGRVGDDPFGRRIVDTLAAAGVDTDFVERDPLRPTGLYLKDPAGSVRYYRRGSAATVHRSLAPAALAGVGHVHLSGITPALSADCAALVGSLIADRAGRDHTVSFDVNYRPGLWSSDAAGATLAGLAARADLVFVGLDEATALWGLTDAAQVRALLPDVGELVVKNGPGPATAFRGPERVAVPAPGVEVVEPIGAGDAFAAGYLAARRAGRDLAAALRSGHLLAGAVLGILGDNGGPPPAALLDAGRPHAD